MATSLIPDSEIGGDFTGRCGSKTLNHKVRNAARGRNQKMGRGFFKPFFYLIRVNPRPKKSSQKTKKFQI